MAYPQNEFKDERLKLGQTIKKLRKERDLTQEELAEKADIDTNYLAKIETAQVNTTVRYLIKIARGLHKKVRDLFEF